MSTPEPNIVMKHSIHAEGDGYYVELGDQRFTQAQWELVRLYAEGTARAELMAYQQEEHELAVFNGNDQSGPGHKAQRQNREFHTAFGIPTPLVPQPIPARDVAVVMELIREEFIDELIPALGATVEFNPDGTFASIHLTHAPDVVEIYDAAIDILYVTYGLLNRAGMDAEPGYDEVQGSNMSKLGEDGKPIIAGEDDPDGIFPGRVKKGPNYYKPNLQEVLWHLGWDGVRPA